MVIFTKKFGTLDPHLPIVWDKVPKKNVFFYTFPNRYYIQKAVVNGRILCNIVSCTISDAINAPPNKCFCERPIMRCGTEQYILYTIHKYEYNTKTNNKMWNRTIHIQAMI